MLTDEEYEGDETPAARRRRHATHTATRKRRQRQASTLTLSADYFVRRIVRRDTFLFIFVNVLCSFFGWILW
jgi:hypothetical protein